MKIRKWLGSRRKDLGNMDKSFLQITRPVPEFPGREIFNFVTTGPKKVVGASLKKFRLNFSNEILII